jgi:hypothetical protein
VNESEAELICGLLRTAEIECGHRPAQAGQAFGGSYEVLVHEEDLETARSMLPSDQ